MPESPNLEGFDQPQSTPEGNLDEEESFSSQTNSGHTCNCPEDDELDSPVPESPSLEGFSQLQLSDEEYLVEGESYESLRARAIRILERLPPSASEIASVLWACMLLADIGRLAEMNNNPLEPYGFDELDEACETLGMAILGK